MPERKRKVKTIYVIGIAVLFAAALIILTGMKNGIVISAGIRTYRLIRRIVIIVGGIVTAVMVILYIADSVSLARQRRARAEEQARREAAAEEQRYNAQKEKETLSVSRNMDSVKLRGILDRYGGGDWKYLSGELQQLHIQLDMMDEQQARLSHLLENNGADALSNTEDILDKVEQHMCRSVRKVINYMDVASPSSREDMQKVQEKIYACHSDNQTQLQQVQEFLFALADFLNSQGDDDGSSQMLDIYKSTILSSLQD